MAANDRPADARVNCMRATCVFPCMRTMRAKLKEKIEGPPRRCRAPFIYRRNHPFCWDNIARCRLAMT